MACDVRRAARSRLYAGVRRGRVAAILALVVFGGATSGCAAAWPWSDGDGAPADGGADAGDGDVSGPIEAVDVLFVVDSGCAGPALRVGLELSVAGLLRDLLEPGPDPATGEVPPAVRSLHVGLTSSSADMGGSRTGFCEEIDDGHLLFDGGGDCVAEAATDCSSPPCPWLAHSDEAPDLGEDPADPPIWRDLECLVEPDRGCGCGWNQPLEAALRALTVQHDGGGPNAGFLQEGSVLALVLVGDSDDCSIADRAILDPDRSDLGPVPRRCALHDELLRPVRDYVESFRSLGHPVVVTVVSALPPETEWSPGDPVEQLAEWVEPDPDDPNVMAPVCTWSGGLGWPPVRLVDFAYDAGAGHFVLSSICGPSWDANGAVSQTARAIQRRMLERTE